MLFINPVKKAMVKYARLMYERGYSTASEGNISFRLGKNRILITPSKKIKKFVSEKDLVEIDMDGNLLRGRCKPTTERFSHLEIYRQNPDVRAVVHAHPFYSVLATVLGENPFEKLFLSEAGMFLKNVKIVPYARPSTPEGAEKIRAVSKDTGIIIIDRHGSFTYGENLEDAFSKLEILEKYSKMAYFANLSGKTIHYIDPQEVEELGKIPY